jgi:putative heme iron utilization protein
MKTVADLEDAVKEAVSTADQVLVIKGVFPTGKRGYFVVQLQND